MFADACGSKGTGKRSPLSRHGQAPVSLTLPVPPSVNEMFRRRNRDGKPVRTGVYNDWRGHAGWMLRQQHPVPIEGSVLAIVSVERTSLAADIDNRVKALLDLLVHHKVIANDNLIVGFCASWAPPANKLARIMLIPAADYAFNFHLSADGAHGGFFLDAPKEQPDGTFAQ